MSQLKRTLILATFTILTTLALPAAAQDIKITGAFFRTSGVVNVSGAGFMEITNGGDEDDRLIAVSTTIARKAELHTHKETGDGIMQMREIDGGIVIPAKGSAILQRGGDHVMLMGITDAPKDGDVITLILTFEKSGDILVLFPLDQDQ